jgi:hypothetical protein
VASQTNEPRAGRERDYLTLGQTIGDAANEMPRITNEPHLLENAAPSFDTNTGVSKRKPQKPTPKQARMNFAYQNAFWKTVFESLSIGA